MFDPLRSRATREKTKAGALQAVCLPREPCQRVSPNDAAYLLPVVPLSAAAPPRRPKDAAHRLRVTFFRDARRAAQVLSPTPPRKASEFKTSVFHPLRSTAIRERSKIGTSQKFAARMSRQAIMQFTQKGEKL